MNCRFCKGPFQRRKKLQYYEFDGWALCGSNCTKYNICFMRAVVLYTAEIDRKLTDDEKQYAYDRDEWPEH